MRFFEVAIRATGGEHSVFTYHSEKALKRGQLAHISLRKRRELGVIWQEVKRPKFKTLPIDEVLEIDLPLPLLDVLEWMSGFYASSLGAALQLGLPSNPEKLVKPRSTIRPTIERPDLTSSQLTEEQQAVITSLPSSKIGTVLLHGETGTGKTRVYGELAARTIANNKSVLILVPEIGMTEQITADLMHYVTQDIIVAHSELTPARRLKLWQTVLETGPHIVIGTRSSLFLPFSDLGLIVVDESHDSSYKNEASPRYQAVRVASQLGQLHKALVVLGSATPSVADYFLAGTKGAPILRMTSQASGHDRMVETSIIDRREHNLFSKSRLLSNAALAAITSALADGQQVLLFLNRRGTARICLCSSCGWLALCNDCELPLTYHHNRQRLLCHSCGREYPIYTACPTCGSVDLAYQSPGVQALTSEIHKFFPQATLARIDSDTTAKEGLAKHYGDLHSGKINILVGTQSIAKGLDLPQLALEVVVDADTSLHLPDYLAGERMFQLLYQVMGRIGRHRPGHIIVQTTTPEHPILASAIDRSYEEFYEYEINARQALRYPPFSHLARIIIERSSEASAIQASQRLFDKLTTLRKLNLRGPSVCYYPKLRSKYRWQIIAMSSQHQALREILPLLGADDILDIDPAQLL